LVAGEDAGVTWNRLPEFLVQRFALFLAVILLAACSGNQADRGSDTTATARPAAPDTTPWTVSLSAYGPIRLGSARAAVLDALGAPPREGEGAAPEECAYMGIPDGPSMRAVRLMVVHDTVVRIDVDSLQVATTWGDRVGDSERTVLARHAGQVLVQPHKYTGPEGHYLIVTAPDDTLHRLVFETDGQRVTTYRAGLRPYVDWVEGCS
jgi:hypothetical protein